MPIYDDDRYDMSEVGAVKKPADDLPLTPEQEAEWLKCAEDKEYWMTNYAAVTAPHGQVLFKPRPYQNRIIATADANRFTINVSGRQTGKTQTLAVDVMHDLIFTSNYRIGISSYTHDATQDIRDRVGEVYENLPNWMKPPVRVYNTKAIKFTNGSSIIFQVTSAKTFRGKSLHRIIIDEFAHVKPNIAEAFWTALLPSITGGGVKAKTRLNIISTPNGTSGKFAELWFGAKSKQNFFAYVEVKYEEVPDRGPEFEKEMLKTMSRNMFDQEYRCAWISDKGTLINSRVIEAIQSKDPIRTVGDLEIFVDSFANRKLMLAADVSEGIGQDYHAFQVFDVDTLEQVAEYHNNVMNQHFYTKAIVSFIEMAMKENCGDFYYTVENNGVGAGVIRLLESSENEYLANAQMISDPNGKKSGLATTGSTKAKSCATFKQMMEMDKFKVHSEKLKVQLKFFVKKGNTFAAESGMHDDLVMACIVMVNMMEQLANYEDNVWDVVHELDDDGGEAVYDIYF